MPKKIKLDTDLYGGFFQVHETRESEPFTSQTHRVDHGHEHVGSFECDPCAERILADREADPDNWPGVEVSD